MISPSESAAPGTAHTLDLSPEAILARAGRQHAMLDRLADLGMLLAEEIVQRAIACPEHPDIKPELGRAYADVAHAVRSTSMLQTRVETQTVAVRNEEPISLVVTTDGARPDSALGATAPGTGAAAAPDASRSARDALLRHVRDAVADVVDLEIPDRETARRALDRLHENLIERESYDALLALPFQSCVAAICADLGLASPDLAG